jgi:CheY-like chemotaxis protein
VILENILITEYTPPYTTKLLLVDDHKENLLALASVLNEPGYQCVLAHSGREALSILLNEQDFSVILLDVQMPEIDGFETARIIHDREKTRDIPVIFITAASTSLDDMLKGYDMNAADYITKPFNEKLLKRKVAVFAELHHKTQKAMQELQELKAIVQQRFSPGSSGATKVPLQKAKQDFRALVDLYKKMLEKYVYEQAYNIEIVHSKLLKSFIGRLGQLQATPRDIIEIHLCSIDESIKQNNKIPESTYIEEGRMLLLEAMGELALYYRSCATGESC